MAKVRQIMSGKSHKKNEAMLRVKKSSKAHQVYKNREGKRVPGCTTITGVLNKPALVPW